MSALPLLAAAAAAAVLLGGKKKTSQSGETQVETTGVLVGEATAVYPSFEGVRRDERGESPWRIKQDDRGFHALLMDPSTQFGITEEDVGVATSESGARTLLRDRLNELLIAEFPDAVRRTDPVKSASGLAGASPVGLGRSA